jgi:hypothetical protein
MASIRRFIDVNTPTQTTVLAFVAAAIAAEKNHKSQENIAMEVQKALKQRAIAAACLVALGLAASGTAFAQVANLEGIAIETVAARLGVSTDQLTVENVSGGKLELQAVLFYGYKIAEKRSATLHSVSLDSTGVEINLDALLSKENDLYLARNGKVDSRLSQILASTSPTTSVPVILWLKTTSEVRMTRPDPAIKLTEAQVDAVFARLDEERGSIATAAATRVVAQLEAQGLKATADGLTPSVVVSIPAGEVRRISALDDVSMAYHDDRYVNQLATSGNTIGAYAVHATGNTGQGVRVAEIEVGGRADLTNPFLSFAFQDNINSCYNNHGTAVGGVIRSTHNPHRGISPGVQLRIGGSCSGNAGQLQAASTRAASWGARTFNLSFGGDSGRVLGAFERYYDDLVQNGWRTVVVAAGNSGNGNGNVLSPALAYNVIAVGAFNDNSFPWAMAGFSSWRDPVSQVGDREKPEVAAPGVNIMTTSGLGITVNPGVNGTSFAAPMVTGASALLMNTNPTLGAWPEAVKSILMASATNNIEGATRLSEFDGAGGIDANRANRIAGNSGGTWGAQGYNCSAAAQTTVSNVFVDQGRRVRTAMAWNANPHFWNFTYANRPGADLDMQIIAPNNTVVASSASWDNTYEIVDFVAPATGTYRLRVTKFSCNHNPKWLGWAWAII